MQLVVKKNNHVLSNLNKNVVCFPKIITELKGDGLTEISCISPRLFAVDEPISSQNWLFYSFYTSATEFVILTVP